MRTDSFRNPGEVFARGETRWRVRLSGEGELAMGDQARRWEAVDANRAANSCFILLAALRTRTGAPVDFERTSFAGCGVG